MLNFADVIKGELERRNRSINWLSDKSDVSSSSLWCWINGSSPKVSSLEKVLDTLGLELKIVEKRKD